MLKRIETSNYTLSQLKEFFIVGIVNKKNIIPQQQRSQLLHFLKSQKPILLVTGNHYSGKTQLIKSITKSKSSHYLPVLIHGQKTITPRHILNELCSVHDTPPPCISLRFETQLQRLLAHFKDKQEQFLLLIDDAHQIPLSSLAALSYLALLQEDTSPNIKLILSGNTELTTRMNCLVTQSLPQLHLSTAPTHSAKEMIQTLTLEKSLNTSAGKQPPPLFSKFTLITQNRSIQATSLLLLVLATPYFLYRPQLSTTPKTLVSLAKVNKKKLFNRNRYEIVLADTSHPHKLAQLIKKNHLTQIAHITPGKKPRYFHIEIKSFASLKMAKKLIQAMPTSLRHLNPKIKRLIG